MTASDGNGRHGPIEAGIFLTSQYLPGSDQVRALEEQIAMTRAARDGGWDSLWVAQHFLPEGMTMLQPMPFLARLVPEAGDMRFGLGILLLALLNPVEVAENIATLDVICRGRLTFGIGLGYRGVESDAFGLGDGGRVRRFTENLRIVRALWSGNPVDADVPWCRLHGAALTTLPVQRPAPPVWMAANSDGAVRRAARLADTWLMNPHAADATIRRQIDLFHATRAAVGRPPATELPLIREVFCARDRATALELAGPYLDRKYQVYSNWGQDKVLPGDESFAVPFASLAQERFVLGSPDDCLRALLPWRDEAGVTHFIIRTHWSGMPVERSLGSMDLLSREVLPVLRGDRLQSRSQP